MTILVDEIHDGDILQILGENNNGEPETWFAEKVGVNSDRMLEVYYIEPTQQSNIWAYPEEENINLVSIESVQLHAPSDKGYKKAWKHIGFRYVRDENGKTSFIDERSSKETDTLVPIGEDDSSSEDEYDSDMESETDSEMDDFIVPDDQGESFTIAANDSEFVSDTHDAVRKYNSWNPQDPSERKIKEYIDTLEHKVIEAEDEKVFNKGSNPIHYKNP